MEDMSIIEWLKAEQSRAGMTDAEFAAVLGISRPMWNALRLGDREPGFQTLAAAARAFPEIADRIRAEVNNRIRALFLV